MCCVSIRNFTTSQIILIGFKILIYIVLQSDDDERKQPSISSKKFLAK